MKKIIKLLLLISVMMMIYMFSSQIGTNSSNTSKIVVDILYRIIRLIIDVDYTKFYDLAITPIRKLAHFSEFFLLGVMAYLNAKECFNNKWVKYSLLFCMAYAMSDEIHQLFVLNRNCSLIDAGIDTLGSLCGIILIHFINRKWIEKY